MASVSTSSARKPEFTTSWQRADELSAPIARHVGSSGLASDSETRLRVRFEPARL